jgi:RimJ/RimL family protein N-acetyltransferase
MKILETDRLFLREFEITDAATLYELNLDPEVIRYTGDLPFPSVEEAEKFLQNYAAYKDFGYGRWLVIRKADDEVLGWCGLKFLPEKNETDIGYRFFKKYWGEGYATEAARACLDYGFTLLNLQTIVARAMHENKASIKVMEKIGMKYWKEDSCAEQPGIVYKLVQNDFIPASPVPAN